jgi:hypothetical protein
MDINKVAQDTLNSELFALLKEQGLEPKEFVKHDGFSNLWNSYVTSFNNPILNVEFVIYVRAEDSFSWKRGPQKPKLTIQVRIPRFYISLKQSTVSFTKMSSLKSVVEKLLTKMETLYVEKKAKETKEAEIEKKSMENLNNTLESFQRDFPENTFRINTDSYLAVRRYIELEIKGRVYTVDFFANKYYIDTFTNLSKDQFAKIIQILAEEK